MITYFCPMCWRAVDREAGSCSHCGGNLAKGLEYVEKLILALDSPESQTARRAAYLLGRLRDPRAVPRLTRLLDGDDPYMAMEAVRALALIGTDEAGRSVNDACDHRFAPVRRLAREILRGSATE